MSFKENLEERNIKEVFANAFSSLTLRCLVIIIVYITAMFGLAFVVSSMVERALSTAFPTVETLDEHAEALAYDQFDELDSVIAEPSQFLVFDGPGGRLYASDAEMATRITAQDLPVINGNEEGRTFYEVLERTDSRGLPLYEIALCSSNADDNAKVVQASCVCEEDGRIVEGDLFAGRDYLTERELSLIRGVYNTQMTIEKHEYRAADGSARTLVLASPIASDASFEAAVNRANALWMPAIPLALVVTALVAAILVYLVRMSMRPLNAAINVRKRAGGLAPAPSDLPLELRPTYESFLDLMGELDEARTAKQRMIADVSHDLKTPLTIIRGYAQAFGDNRVPPEKTAEYLRAIDAKSEVACDLIDALLLYAKMDHPSYRAELERCDLCEALRLIAIDKEADIKQTGCTLMVEIPDEPLFASIDSALLKRAVDNILGNACVHNPAGTTIRVTCIQSRSEAVIFIADNGRGIPEELRATAFEPFVTNNEARSSGKGTGLGLAIAGKCVQTQGGTLSFAEHPAPPYATEVVIKLPLGRG